MRATVTRYKAGAVLALLWLLLCAPAVAAAPVRTVLVMGDSLAAAYGLSPAQGWVALLGQRLEQNLPGWRVVNASVSGETTGGGAARLTQALQEHTPAVVILELGANDALRGLPLELAQANLQRMIEAARETRAKVLLIGIQIPPNYGPQYTRAFAAMYPELASGKKLALVPFLLEKVALEPQLMQSDGLHPNEKGQPLLLETVWPYLQPLLQR